MARGRKEGFQKSYCQKRGKGISKQKLLSYRRRGEGSEKPDIMEGTNKVPDVPMRASERPGRRF